LAPTEFVREKTSKIRLDFRQLSILIANISVTVRHNENLKSTWSTTSNLLLCKKFCELWSTNKSSYKHLRRPTRVDVFRRLHFGPWGAAAQTFARATTP